MAQKIIGAQRDFSFGAVDVSLKRNDDHAARKGGLRQMSNMRILNSGAIQERSGRSALFPATTAARIEEVTMSAGNTFKLAFGTGLQIYNSAGVLVANLQNRGNGNPLPWTPATAYQIDYAVLDLSIYITFGHAMRPQVVTWDGVATWTIAEYTEQVLGLQKRTPFYRMSVKGATLLPGARTGSGVSLVSSENLFTAAHVGTRMRYINRQMLITGVTDPKHATVTIMEPIPGEQDMTFASDPRLNFTAGDVVFGSQSGSQGIVLLVNATTVAVQLTTTNTATVSPDGGFSQRVVSFITSETLVGPGGSQSIGSAGPIINPGIGTTFWDEEIMNDYRGYPASVFVDQFRLGFCDFPVLPNGIAWSAISTPADLYPAGATVPSGAIFELTPDKVRVYYVVAGPESSEFVFCDNKLYYIKIDASNPLTPGSVGFQTLSGDGCAQVKPRASQEIILYINAGRSSVMAIVASGAYYRPFNTKSLTAFHSSMFDNIKCIAVPTADGDFEERYAYILNGDGSLVVGKYSTDDLVGNSALPKVGWGPWTGVGALQWVASWAADVVFTTSYFGTTICEVLDDSRYLDASLFVNQLPAPFAAPPGKGPLWWIPSQTVSLMDQGTRSMGVYNIDADGFIVPQGNAGENLAATTLVAGQLWTAIVEPFAPNAQPGADAGQRMKMRQISYIAAYVIHSTGFMLGHLFSGRVTATSPALGTLMNFRRFPAWDQGDDPTLPPPQRETVEQYSPQGSSYDPRAVLIKDTPGPLQLLELAIEVSI